MMRMKCFFCGNDTVFIANREMFGRAYGSHAECAECGAQGRTHNTSTAAAQEWQRIADAVRAAENPAAPVATLSFCDRYGHTTPGDMRNGVLHCAICRKPIAPAAGDTVAQ